MRASRLAAITLGVLLSAAPAWAIPIGDFSWDGDDFLFGPLFTVLNAADSGGAFTDVVVHLTFSDGSSDSLSLGTIAQGESASTTEDLLSFSIASASLSFVFDLPGEIVVGSLFAFGDSQAIDFTPASVPEPSTLLLLTAGMAGAAWRTRRRRAGEPFTDDRAPRSL